MINPALKESILSTIRHGLTTLGGGVVSAGWLSASDLNIGVGALMTIIGLGWGIAEKFARADK